TGAQRSALARFGFGAAGFDTEGQAVLEILPAQEGPGRRAIEEREPLELALELVLGDALVGREELGEQHRRVESGEATGIVGTRTALAARDFAQQAERFVGPIGPGCGPSHAND